MTTYIQKMYKPPVLAGLGNILLDLHAIIGNQEVLRKYDLKMNDQKEVDKETFMSLLNEVSEKKEVIHSPGGCAQNTLRLFQWLIGNPFYTVIFGGIGKDKYGKMVEEMVKSEGVLTRYTYHDKFQTGTTVALVNGDERSLVAHIGAAGVYRPNDLDLPENWEILSLVHMVYVEGYFITHDFPTAMKVVDFCKTKGICFATNLCASYVCENYTSEMAELLKYADVIIGNKCEFLTFGKAMKWKSSNISEIMHSIKKLTELETNPKHRRKDLPKLLKSNKIIVVTQSKDPVLVLDGKSTEILEFCVPILSKDSIKDTTGAGDAFIAGFLAGSFLSFDLEKCIKLGCWTAQQIIQQFGVKVPNYLPDYSF